MTTDKFKSFEVDGAGQTAMPLTIADQILVKPIPQLDGAALLLRSKPDETTGEHTETQWYLTPDQAEWLSENLQNCLADIRRRSRKRRRRSS